MFRKIVDIAKGDEFYETKGNFINKIVKINRISREAHPTIPRGFICCYVEMISEMSEKFLRRYSKDDICFWAVKLRKLTREELEEIAHLLL